MAENRGSRTASATKIAELLGVHSSTVLSWVDRGCPVLLQEPMARKMRRIFDIDAVTEWRQQDLVGREKPRPDFKEAPSLSDSFIDKEHEGRFGRIMEGMMRPANK